MTSKIKLMLTFAQPIKQVASNQVVIEVEQGPSVFSQEFIDSVCKTLGSLPGELWLEEINNQANLKLITSGITSHSSFVEPSPVECYKK